MATLKDSQAVAVLAVDDIARATAFYRDKLGLRVDPAGADPGSAIARAGDGSWIMLYTSTFKRGETTAASFVVEDIEDLVKDLQSKGVTFQDYDQPGLKTENGIATIGELKAAWFNDSEGNILSLAQGGM